MSLSTRLSPGLGLVLPAAGALADPGSIPVATATSPGCSTTPNNTLPYGDIPWRSATGGSGGACSPYNSEKPTMNLLVPASPGCASGVLSWISPGCGNFRPTSTAWE